MLSSCASATAAMLPDRDSSSLEGQDLPALSPRPRHPGTAPRHFPAPQETIVQQPPGSALTFSSPDLTHTSSTALGNHGNKSISGPLQHNHRTGHDHAHAHAHAHAKEQVERAPGPSPPRAASTSLTSFLPASIKARLQPLPPPPTPHQRQPSSIREEPGDDEDDDEDMGLTGEGRKTRRELAESQLETYVSPPSQAASEGIPSPETTPKRIIRTSNLGTVDNAPKSAGPFTAPSRLSLLTMFSRNTPADVTPEMHDELLSMKVEEALFPAGAPNGKDTFSPAAFKNLQTQATGLLTKMQNAYRQKAQALDELQREREADRDELDEALTRNKHLKFQLEDMALKVAEQEQHMKQLMDELSTERRARAELERLGAYPKQRLSPGGLASEAGSTISEDLGVDEEELQKRKWRKSNGTDTSFETDDDSMSCAGESVFSRPRSPSVSTTTTTRGVETSSVVDMPITSMRGPNASKRASTQSNRPRSQMSTFQKLMKGIAGDDGCSNCKGQDASTAWDTVSLLRDENKHLKSRVGELEDCLESALDAVNGIGL